MGNRSNQPAVEFVILAVLLLVVGGAVGLYLQRLSHEQQNFQELSSRVAALVAKVAPEGGSVGQDTATGCRYSRPNVYDNKRLICEAYAAVYTKAGTVQDAKAAARVIHTKILGEFGQAVDQQLDTGDGNDPTKFTADSLFTYRGKALACRIEFRYPSTGNPGYYLPQKLYEDTLQTVFGCSGDARRAYFPLLNPEFL